MFQYVGLNMLCFNMKMCHGDSIKCMPFGGKSLNHWAAKRKILPLVN